MQSNPGSYDSVLTADIDALHDIEPEARQVVAALERVRIGVRLWVKHDEIVASLRALTSLLASVSPEVAARAISDADATPSIVLPLLKHQNESVVEEAGHLIAALGGHGTYTRVERVAGEDRPLRLWVQPAQVGTGATLWRSARAIVADEICGPLMAEGRDVLELGCGVGLVGLACARCGAESVVLTDSRPEVLQLATNNARRNDLGDVRVAHLDWAAPEASALAAEGARFSLVVAADCVYAAPGSEAGAALPLAHVIARFLAPDGRALVALDADPKRGAAAVEEVAQFDGAARAAGLRCVHAENRADGVRARVYVKA